VLRGLSNPTAVFTDFPVSKTRSTLDGADAGTETQAAFAFSDAPREQEFSAGILRESRWKRGKHKTDVRNLLRWGGGGLVDFLVLWLSADSATAKAQQ